MHSSELGQESLKELNLNRVTRNSAIGQPLVDRRSVPSERTSEHVEARRNVSTSLDRPRGIESLRSKVCVPQVAEFGMTVKGFYKYYFQDCL